jgi:reactive intermediate/imine deaminase
MKSSLSALLLLLTTSSSVVAQDQSPNIQHINPPTLSPPHGYTQVVTAEGGRIVFVAGQVPMDKNGKLVGAGDFAAQVRQTFTNLRAALAASGADFSHVVDMTTYVTDMSQIDTYRSVRNQYMTSPLPAASLVQVKGLFRSDVMVEVSAIAVVPATAPKP